MSIKKKTWRGLFVAVFCFVAAFAVSTAGAEAKTKTKGKLCKGVKWSYSAKKKTLTISGKGYAKISGFRKSGEYRWPGSEEQTLPAFKKIVFKDGITKIDYAFFAMEGIKSISLPKTLKSISYQSTCYVNGNYDPWSTTLTSISVSKKNKKYSSSKGVLYSKNKKALYVYPSGKTKQKYTISGKVTKIGSRAFYGSDIEAVKLPANLISIGSYAFYNSTIRAVQINKKLQTIGNEAFHDTELTDITLPESIKTIGNDAFEGCKFNSVVLPKNLTKVGNNAFAYNRKLSKLVIQCNCDVSDAFSWCSSYYDYDEKKEYRKIEQDIAVTLGKNMEAPVADLIDELGSRIMFSVESGNRKYYMSGTSLYATRGKKLLYTPVTPSATQSPAPSATQSPAPSATQSPAPSATQSPAPSATQSPVPDATETPAPTDSPSAN